MHIWWNDDAISSLEGIGETEVKWICDVVSGVEAQAPHVCRHSNKDLFCISMLMCWNVISCFMLTC
jgi:hypothetical protein